VSETVMNISLTDLFINLKKISILKNLCNGIIISILKFKEFFSKFSESPKKFHQQIKLEIKNLNYFKFSKMNIQLLF
jgi:hypothetical protein